MAGRPNYRTAPLKAITRHMIVEICRRMIAFGDLRDYVYVGLGGLEFVDFELVHRTLGVETMYSIECDEWQDRLEFNKPYEKIHILHGRTGDVLTDVLELDSKRSIVWLDYVDRLNQSVLSDLAYVASKMASGSALFVTLNCHFGEKITLDEIERDFGDYFDPGLKRGAYNAHGLGNQQITAMEMALGKALRPRIAGFSVERALDVRYQDSARMQVGGWVLTAEADEPARSLCRLGELEFTSPARGGEFLNLGWPELTAMEWDSLAKQLPVRDPAELSPPHNSISTETLKKFAAIYRFSRLERLYA